MALLDTAPPSKFSRFELIWLAYLVFFFIEPVMRKSLTYWLESLAIVSVFLALYFGMLLTESLRLKHILVAAIFLLGVGFLHFNTGAACFIIYAAAMLPFTLVSSTTAFAFIGGIAAAFAIEGWLIHFNVFSISLDIFFVFVVGGSNVFFAQKKRADCKLRMAHEEIEALAALAERERIARDLHDVLGHTLSVIVLKAELAKRLIHSNPERAALEIADVETTARKALSEVREAIGGYRARGLLAEIESARRTLDAAGVTLIADATSTGTANLTAAEETVLALALREAVTNIVRHAQAKTCRLRFVTAGGRRRLLVEDDGEHPLTREGNGLRGMRERVEALGGSVSLDRNCGTHLLIELPLHTEGATS